MVIYGAAHLAAAKSESWDEIDTPVHYVSGVDFEKAEIPENVHRAELTKFELDPKGACGTRTESTGIGRHGVDTLTHGSGSDGATFGHADNLLRPPPLPDRCDPARGLALPALHLELP